MALNDDDLYCGGSGDEDDDCSDMDDGLIDYDDGFIDNASDDSDNFASNHNQQPYSRTQKYKILGEDDLRKLQEESITGISTVLSVSRVAASILLRHYNWNVNKVNDEWFADEEKVRKTVGLPDNQISIPDAEETTCGICFDDYPSNKMSAANCGHPFCSECWEGYISSAINDGPGCLMLCCPDPSCDAAVDQEMVNKLALAADKKKYNRYLLRSFVEDNKKIKWCPGPGCEYAVDFITSSGNYDVTCECSHSFCWKCVEEAHRPVDCETVAKWLMKNSAESENMTWILANSKPCPLCKRPIEKNQGCMHMTCSPPCRHEFCWLCLGSWKDHGEATGGFYSCNRYEAAKEEGEYDEDEKRREMARSLLERYYHYYERWATNHSSRQQAFENLRQLEAVDLTKLSTKQCQPESQLKFITEAWLQIVECRRVLMWTYAYGYFLPPKERAKKRFFEYLQGEAEAGLERLHKCAEKECETFLESEGPLEEFSEFRIKLAGLTSVTKNYFENLVRALENGLADVDSHAASADVEPESPPKVRDIGGWRGEGESPEASPERRTDINELDHWYCDYCTFANPMSATHCEVCEQARFSRLVE